MGLHLESLPEKTHMKTIGLIVNPIAGMGGAVALKGTDGDAILREARRLGAEPRAHERTQTALSALVPLKGQVRLLCGGGAMGEDAARSLGIEPEVVFVPPSRDTGAADTIAAASIIKERGVDLLLFAGGDGTARDVFTAVGTTLPVLGIPAGVKIHSAVFAQNPRLAGELAALVVAGKVRDFMEAEVMDIDEEQYRREILSARLFGYLTIPLQRRFTQRLKAGSPQNERYVRQAIAAAVMEGFDETAIYLLGAGTTIRPIGESMGVAGSLLGIDVAQGRSLLVKDATESQLREVVAQARVPVYLVLTPIGGQGYVLGRGNQQLSPAVLRKIDKRNIMIVSAPGKLAALAGQPLLLDTGDAALDRELSGYYRVITGFRQSSFYRVEG